MGCCWAGRDSHLDCFPFSLSFAYLNFCNTDRKREKEKSKRANFTFFWRGAGARARKVLYWLSFVLLEK